jgi:hypothetical protein
MPKRVQETVPLSEERVVRESPFDCAAEPVQRLVELTLLRTVLTAAAAPRLC